MSDYDEIYLSKSLENEIAAKLHLHTIGLLKVPGEAPPFQIGSGTLVCIDGRCGILTAHHVAHVLSGRDHLGLAISQHPHEWKVNVELIRIVDVSEPVSDEFGPDLSFIELPERDVARIKGLSNLAFLPLLPNRQSLLENPPSRDEGIWVICGVPGELTENETADAGFNSILSFGHFSHFSRSCEVYDRNGFDYAELEINYSEKSISPRNLHGISGGGLWQVLLERSETGTDVCYMGLLSGVAFFQEELINEKRHLRCHFRESIYRQLFNKVLNM